MSKRLDENLGSVGYWAKMAAGVKNQTAKWYKTDKERAAKLDAQKRRQ